MASFLPKYFLAPKTSTQNLSEKNILIHLKKETGVIEVVLIKISFLLRHTYLRESTRSRLERKKCLKTRETKSLQHVYIYVNVAPISTWIVLRRLAKQYFGKITNNNCNLQFRQEKSSFYRATIPPQRIRVTFSPFSLVLCKCQECKCVSS